MSKKKSHKLSLLIPSSETYFLKYFLSVVGPPNFWLFQTYPSRIFLLFDLVQSGNSGWCPQRFSGAPAHRETAKSNRSKRKKNTPPTKDSFLFSKEFTSSWPSRFKRRWKKRNGPPPRPLRSRVTSTADNLNTGEDFLKKNNSERTSERANEPAREREREGTHILTTSTRFVESVEGCLDLVLRLAVGVLFLPFFFGPVVLRQQ